VNGVTLNIEWGKQKRCSVVAGESLHVGGSRWSIDFMEDARPVLRVTTKVGDRFTMLAAGLRMMAAKVEAGEAASRLQELQEVFG
jgi:hypothetical protein